MVFVLLSEVASMNSYEEYYCPKCGVTLNGQYGFTPGNGNWSCASCGQELYGGDIYEGDIYPGIMWHCDQCGALLNKQDGFVDSCGSWTCTECYHTNPISEDTILELNVDNG
jgi:ribosomal protein L37AE/L43A